MENTLSQNFENKLWPSMSFKYIKPAPYDEEKDENNITVDSIPNFENKKFRSSSADKNREVQFYDLITINPSNCAIYMDPRLERKRFINHLAKLKRAHKLQLENVKYMVINI